MAFHLDGLIASSESWEGNASQCRKQARAIIKDLLSTDLPPDFAVYVQTHQKSVNHLFQMASHITLKSASDFVRNVLFKATEMTPGQATYILHQVLECTEAIVDSERVQITSFPEKELLLPSFVDNLALCLTLMDHPLSPVPPSSVGLAQALSLGGLSPSHPGRLTSSICRTTGDPIPLIAPLPYPACLN